MTLTLAAFKSDRYSDPTGEMLVNVVVVSPGQVLTPCQPVGVRRVSHRAKKHKQFGRWSWWQPSELGYFRNTEPANPPATTSVNTPVSTKEDDDWATRSWNTLRERMDDDEE